MNSLNIFLEKIKKIIHNEQRPFCFRDFLSFELDGKEYRYKYGTIRNNFLKLKKMDKIELVFNAGAAFYTLKGVKVGKPITPNHTSVDYLNHKQRTFLQFLQHLPMDKPAIHNIRLRFKSPSLWSILPISADSKMPIKNIDLKNNKDITLDEIDLKDHVIKTTVHNTDTVSVIISCSKSPIPLDIFGLSKLTSSLTRVEERLQRVIDSYINFNLKSNRVSKALKYAIPNHKSWIVIMWHFGQDSLTTYKGEKFEITVEEALQLFRVYSKESEKNKPMRIRKEVQECPDKPLEDAFLEKTEHQKDNDSTYYI
jgi:hypothetical protein